MSVLVEIERILRSAQRRIRGLEHNVESMDMVLIELVTVNLDMNIENLRAASSPESANIEAEEEPSAQRH